MSRTKAIMLSLTLLAFSFPAYGHPSKSAPRWNQKLTPVLVPAVQCDAAQLEELFAQALQRIWIKSRDGMEPYEAGFALDRVGAAYYIVLAPMAYEKDMELQIPLNSVGMTIAVAHTHPNTAIDVPSSIDRRHHLGDVYSPVPNFVVSRSGVWVTDPSTHTFRNVAGSKWNSKPRGLGLAQILRAADSSLANNQFSISYTPAALDGTANQNFVLQRIRAVEEFPGAQIH